MMQIQVINHNGRPLASKENFENIKFSTFNNPQSLDEFAINIFNLGHKDIWCNAPPNIDSIKCINDFTSIGTMIEESNKSINIVIIPQNYNFSYQEYSGGYGKRIQLKDMLSTLQNKILTKLNPALRLVDLVYENTRTKINQSEANASFYFSNNSNAAMTYSIDSCKITTVDYTETNKVILTTLDLSKQEDIINFLKEIKLIAEKEDVPKWMVDIQMFDDEIQNEIITHNYEEIEKLQENIVKAEKIIEKNDLFKSILYTSGDELVKVVFMILEEILACNLSEFTDKKKEDFVVKVDDKYFIGEIKGVTPNIKSENISQLDVHYQSFLGNNNLTEEDVKAILIMNHQRNKQLNSREKVNETQIKLAERNDSLIIETITLLKLFENFINKQLTSDECRKLLFSNKGILYL